MSNNARCDRMWYKYAMCLLGCAATPLFADMGTNTTQPVATDEDLFLKNKAASFINLEFLYWTVNESATDYALKMKHPAWSTTDQTYAIGEFENATFDWGPGVRISGGYFRAPHFWDAYAQYTFLHAEGENESHAPNESNRFLTGTWIGPDFNTGSPPAPLHSAKSNIDFYYNLVDILFSRRFHPNDHLRLNLFGGGTGAFFHQHWKVRYTDINAKHSTIRNGWSFAGAGLRLGLKVDWFMGYNIYITGMSSSALLSGKYENGAHQKTSATIAGANNGIPFRNTHFDDVRLTFNAQFLAGPSWQKAFNSVRTEFFVGYEFTMWTNLHAIYRSSLAAATAGKDTYINNSDVCLQGLTVRWTLDF